MAGDFYFGREGLGMGAKNNKIALTAVLRKKRPLAQRPPGEFRLSANAADRYLYNRLRMERESGWGEHGPVKILMKDGKPVDQNGVGGQAV